MANESGGTAAAKQSGGPALQTLSLPKVPEGGLFAECTDEAGRVWFINPNSCALHKLPVGQDPNYCVAKGYWPLKIKWEKKARTVKLPNGGTAREEFQIPVTPTDAQIRSHVNKKDPEAYAAWEARKKYYERRVDEGELMAPEVQ
jgi:hypothetical protein